METPRRILFVSHVATCGGGEHSLLDLLHALDRRCFSPWVVLPHSGDLSRALEVAGVSFETCAALCRLRRPRRPGQWLSQGWRMATGALSLRRSIRRFRPHLIHANSTSAALFTLALGAGGLPGRPAVLWHLRDLALPGVVGYWLGRRATRVVVPSEACRRRVERWVPPGRIEQITNGICLEPRVPESFGSGAELPPGNGPLLLTIGQLAPWKGHELAVEAMRHLHQHCPTARLALIGDDRFGDHPEATGRLRRQIDDAGLSSSVALLGFRTDVRQLLARADLLIHPTFPEPFGRVVVEAMAAACPVVAFAGDHGPAEILRDGVDGLLVSPRTPQVLAAGARELLEDPLRCRAMGAAAKTRARALFDRAFMARRIEALYRSLAPEDAL